MINLIDLVFFIENHKHIYPYKILPLLKGKRFIKLNFFHQGFKIWIFKIDYFDESEENIIYLFMISNKNVSQVYLCINVVMFIICFFPLITCF